MTFVCERVSFISFSNHHILNSGVPDKDIVYCVFVGIATVDSDKFNDPTGALNCALILLDSACIILQIPTIYSCKCSTKQLYVN